ncbi:hypothetical protein [Paenisporosarcina sp. OV554]|nr:hypothetical protein [Paenisporosarcina sp. OV554]
MRPTSMRFSYLLAHAERAVAQMYDKQLYRLTDPLFSKHLININNYKPNA